MTQKHPTPLPLNPGRDPNTASLHSTVSFSVVCRYLSSPHPASSGQLDVSTKPFTQLAKPDLPAVTGPEPSAQAPFQQVDTP